MVYLCIWKEWFVCICFGGWEIGRSDMPFVVLVYTSDVSWCEWGDFSIQARVVRSFVYINVTKGGEFVCFDKPRGQGFLSDSVSAIHL